MKMNQVVLLELDPSHIKVLLLKRNKGVVSLTAAGTFVPTETDEAAQSSELSTFLIQIAPGCMQDSL